jgi:hypothetical protein
MVSYSYITNVLCRNKTTTYLSHFIQLTSKMFTDSPNKSTVTLNVADRGKYDFGEKMRLLS